MIDWVPGDFLGLDIPAHREALRSGGETFLTRAFRATGALTADNAVARITQFEDCPGGSTGRKLLLSVDYDKPSPALHTQLFVKFSRDFEDDIRDHARIQMEREVSFALLSRSPDFPITVPACYFADYEQETGTGILITQRIPFGTGDIEQHYDKCLDHRMPEPLQHYRALITALARLAGTQQAGRLANAVAQQFPFDPSRQSVSQRKRYSAQQISNRVCRYAEFAAAHAGLLPESIRSADFLARLAEEAPRFMSLMPAVEKRLARQPEFIALCHWNANIDNAWFWRNATGALECGLLDWGNVSQMNVAMALWGCLSAAETDIWNLHLEELLLLFIKEFTQCGGAALDTTELKQHILLYAGMMGLTWMLDAPALLVRLVPNLAEVENRFDARINGVESARSQLQIMTVFLNLWETQDMATLLDELERSRDKSAGGAG